MRRSHGSIWKAISYIVIHGTIAVVHNIERNGAGDIDTLIDFLLPALTFLSDTFYDRRAGITI